MSSPWSAARASRRRTSRRLSEPELEAWAAGLGRTTRAPRFIALRGPLGAGKSTFARAMLRGAGIPGPIPSPTYNLLFRYDAPDGRVFVHLDLYRVSTPAELVELGWEELGADDEVVLVEWPERAGVHLPEGRWDLSLDLVPSAPDRREATLVAVGGAAPAPGPEAGGLVERR